jgi:hypothetical protein
MVTMGQDPNTQFSKAHLTSLNLNNFKTIEAMGLKIAASGLLECNYLCTSFHENVPSGSEVISGTHTHTHTHTQTDRQVSL